VVEQFELTMVPCL